MYLYLTSKFSLVFLLIVLKFRHFTDFICYKQYIQEKFLGFLYVVFILLVSWINLIKPTKGGINKAQPKMDCA